MNPRVASRSRSTKETSIDISLDLDGSGQATADTGLPFFDHMLTQIGRHGGFDLTIVAKGDLEVDQHHTVEDVAILLGETLAEALGDKAGIERFASRTMVLDEARVEVALDLSGRPYLVYDVDLWEEAHHLGTPPFNPEMFEHFWQSFATSARMTLHIVQTGGRNTHHIVEACFKGVARCLRDAVRVEGTDVPSTKGTL